jgi:hypothetical protein
MIAALTGASPETVRTVRARLLSDRPDHGGVVSLTAGSDHRGEVSRAAGAGTLPAGADAAIPFSETDPGGTHVDLSGARVDDVWISDLALRACGDGGEFARWFDTSNVDDRWHRYVWTVPVGRIYDVVDEARRRAASWTAFASLLESRTR